MNKLIRTFEPVRIYREHSLKSRVIRETTVDEYISYNRVKLREKVRWYEVLLENNQVGYIQKDNTKVFKCSYVEMEDDESQGFHYTLKEGADLRFDEIFFPERSMVPVDDSSDTSSIKSVEIAQIKDLEKGKKRYAHLYYDSNVVDIETFVVRKKETFYLTYEPDILSKEVFIEVDNFKDKKGYLFKKTNHSLVSDKWMTYLSYFIIITCTIVTFLACLAAEWLVIGLILIIPGIIVGFLAMLVLQIVISILKGIFHEIHVRM